jgi:hypothetical protein
MVASIAVTLTRDSVCMADDVDAPHEEVFAFDPELDLMGMARHIARSSYLPMPSDAWGWTIEHGSAVVAVRPRLLTRYAICLRGDPATVRAADIATLSATYVRPNSPWRLARHGL